MFYDIFGSDEISTANSSSYSATLTILAALKLSFILVFSQAISWHLYQIYMTEIYHFELQPRDPTDLSLVGALSLNSHPYIQVKFL